MVTAGKLQPLRAGGVLFPELERRRSDRVVLQGGGLDVRIKGLGPGKFLDLSLGGATIETSSRLEPNVSYRVCIQYGSAQEDVEVRIYRSSVHELYYSTSGGSRLRCRAKVVFAEPSVATLNLLYRIMKEHWVEPWFDDTRPYQPDAETATPSPSPRLVRASTNISRVR